ncbi:hypothetical protein M0805_001868 [Coniferiporia weirii]|nr:hypothetical protein M0805_001868 [Coniferiporia weirii]
MSTQSDLNIDRYVTSLNILQWGRLSHLASFSLIAYDIFITIDQEIEYIWKARWSFGKIVFIINRYLNLIVKTCVAWLDLQTFETYFIFLLTDIILQMRVYALYDKSKKILLLMLVPFVLIFIKSSYDLIVYAIYTQATATPLPGIPNFCEPLPNKYGKSYIYWAQLLGFETLLVVLVCAKAYKSYKAESEDPWGSGTSLADILIRDSVIYFFAIFAAFAANLVISPIDKGNLQEIPSGFANAVSGIMSQRLILNMRESYYSTCEPGRQSVFDLTTWRMANVSSHNAQETTED